MNTRLKRLALHAQGLGAKARFGTGIDGTHQAIAHLGYVQIDTLSVVQRAHHHVLWNRVPAYDPADLNRLVGEKKIFEYWFHAAAYLPMRDYRFALPRMTSIRNGESRYFCNGDTRLMQEIVAKVRSEGALGLRDLETGGARSGSWWSGGPARRAVETLFMRGELMVCERRGAEKRYDLAERCLPEGIDLSVPSTHAYAAHLFDTHLRAHGAVTSAQVLHLRTGQTLRAAVRDVVRERLDAGVVQRLQGIGGLDVYVDSAAATRIPALPARVTILSPFDNLIIHRDRLSALFGFDYRIECYTPANKRAFGYFCLPVLHGDVLVARIDCKAHRKEGRLEVISTHWEATADREPVLPRLADALQRFATFNGCHTVDDPAHPAP
ncbi:winged helix-turn-helix domain-containing protein [Stenotrophomonas sp. GZD-301]|uniref:winged helix-turn-helix domain-containing protein n=1 Tax=Stenotrophomonas sp. GZD-301 TaxID=3404814 RepID=UPI003BB5BBAC